MCLDNTPLVQTCDSNGKSSYATFGSVVRLKSLEEIEGILFKESTTDWLYRKLCLLNIVTLLTNIREMARLFI